MGLFDCIRSHEGFVLWGIGVSLRRERSSHPLPDSVRLLEVPGVPSAVLNLIFLAEFFTPSCGPAHGGAKDRHSRPDSSFGQREKEFCHGQIQRGKIVQNVGREANEFHLRAEFQRQHNSYFSSLAFHLWGTLGKRSAIIIIVLLEGRLEIEGTSNYLGRVSFVAWSKLGPELII